MWLTLRKNFRHIPGWIDFYIKLRENVPISESTVRYLDCFDAPATNMSTINFMMKRSLKIKDQLNLNLNVCFYIKQFMPKHTR